MSEIPSGIIGALVSLMLLFAGLAIGSLLWLLWRNYERTAEALQDAREVIAGYRAEREATIKALREGGGRYNAPN